MELFARQAAVLLANGQTLSDARRINVQLTDALEKRDVISQAKGILLERGAVDPAGAFGMLLTRSQQANAKVHLVARYLVTSVASRNANSSADGAR